jgi:hypothetical protein
LKTIAKILILVGLILLGGIIFACFSINKKLEPRPRPTPAPINNYLKKELCKKLDDSLTESICRNEDAVLASDTFRLFEEKFRPHVTTQDDIANLLGSANWEDVTPFSMYPRYHQYDLAGTGVNRIIMWTNHKNIIKSVVFIREDMLTPLPQDTVVDLCGRLDLGNAKPCTDNGVIYAQDFFPFIKEKFLDRRGDADLL